MPSQKLSRYQMEMITELDFTQEMKVTTCNNEPPEKLPASLTTPLPQRTLSDFRRGKSLLNSVSFPPHKIQG